MLVSSIFRSNIIYLSIHFQTKKLKGYNHHGLMCCVRGGVSISKVIFRHHFIIFFKKNNWILCCILRCSSIILRNWCIVCYCWGTNTTYLLIINNSCLKCLLRLSSYYCSFLPHGIFCINQRFAVDNQVLNLGTAKNHHPLRLCEWLKLFLKTH